MEQIYEESRERERGFSLVELSIVLVILGLLTGGILAGQSLIRASELRSVISDSTRYTTSVHTFRDKYFGLPGDITNATSFWGIAAGTGSDATCAAFQSTSAATCNGNGDGIFGGTAAYMEEFRFWQHLANAGLIEGKYNGAPNAAAPLPTPGSNCPKSKISNAGFGVGYVYSTSYFEGYWGTQSLGNTMFFGGNQGDAMRSATILKPEEAWNIDTKLDDGRPDQGFVQGGFMTSACFTASSSPSNYALTTTSNVCALSFYLR